MFREVGIQDDQDFQIHIFRLSAVILAFLFKEPLKLSKYYELNLQIMTNLLRGTGQYKWDNRLNNVVIFVGTHLETHVNKGLLPNFASNIKRN